MGSRKAGSNPLDLAALRQTITELVAHNAVFMVQQAIDAVRDDGQYQAMKYLFEMIGLYPANLAENSEPEDSLAKILLQRLELPTDLGKDSGRSR
jgi:hypothetical protein